MSGYIVVVPELPPCDFCKEQGLEKPYPARYDGKTTFGPWAYMCNAHYSVYGMGLGLGVGQRLVLESEK